MMQALAESADLGLFEASALAKLQPRLGTARRRPLPTHPAPEPG